MLRLCTNRLGSAGVAAGLNPLGRVPRPLSSSLPSLRFSYSSSFSLSFSSVPSALAVPRSVTSSSCPLILGTRLPTASFSSPFGGSPSPFIRLRRHNSTSSSSSEKGAAAEGSSTSANLPSSATSLGGAASAAAVFFLFLTYLFIYLLLFASLTSSGLLPQQQEAARKRAAEVVMQEYAALFRPGPQAPKEEFTARVRAPSSPFCLSSPCRSSVSPTTSSSSSTLCMRRCWARRSTWRSGERSVWRWPCC